MAITPAAADMLSEAGAPRFFGGLNVEEAAEVLGNFPRNGQARLEDGEGVVISRTDP
jgi:hypothetical protein